MLIEILAVIRDREIARRRFFFQRMRQTKIAKLEVMAVGLSVRCHVHHLLSVDRVRQCVNEFATRGQQFLKRQRARRDAVLKENSNRFIRMIAMRVAIRETRVDRACISGQPVSG